MRWLALGALALLVSCSRATPPAPPTPIDPLVHTLVLPSDLTPELPEGAGQPRLPRKTWQAEVDKMRNVYGAPVPAEDVGKIVEYLVATHGAG